MAAFLELKWPVFQGEGVPLELLSLAGARFT